MDDSLIDGEQAKYIIYNNLQFNNILQLFLNLAERRWIIYI